MPQKPTVNIYYTLLQFSRVRYKNGHPAAKVKRVCTLGDQVYSSTQQWMSPYDLREELRESPRNPVLRRALRAYAETDGQIIVHLPAGLLK